MSALPSVPAEEHARPSVNVIRYTDEMAPRWDAFVRASRNGTFLFERGYMDYHRDRFGDHSFIVTRGEGEWLAILPASLRGGTLSSHPGLTYGGFVTSERMTTPTMLACFDALVCAARASGCERIVYKTVPHIYHRIPSQDDQYALFRHGAALHRRDVLSVIERGAPRLVQERRRRGVKKAQKNGVTVERSGSYDAYWPVLESTLKERHGTRPVHSLEEIRLLASRFPEQIQLHQACRDGRVLAGIVLYLAGPVAHVQYIAATSEGREVGALDLLLESLIADSLMVARWFDFGISNEEDGRVLNEGLIEQKEGFGARAVIHDHYTMNIGTAT